jgi:hypothetical protein
VKLCCLQTGCTQGLGAHLLPASLALCGSLASLLSIHYHSHPPVVTGALLARMSGEKPALTLQGREAEHILLLCHRGHGGEQLGWNL